MNTIDYGLLGRMVRAAYGADCIVLSRWWLI